MKVVSVEWGYENHDVRLTEEDWLKIQRGLKVVRSTTYGYEGEEFMAKWIFNGSPEHSLVVEYVDLGQGFVGSIDDAEIRVEP